MLCNSLFCVLCHQVTAVVSPVFPHLPFAADRPVEDFISLCVSSQVQLQMGTSFCDTVPAHLDSISIICLDDLILLSPPSVLYQFFISFEQNTFQMTTNTFSLESCSRPSSKLSCCAGNTPKGKSRYTAD